MKTIEFRLALRSLLGHCPERWQLELFWNAAGQETPSVLLRDMTVAFNDVFGSCGQRVVTRT